MQSEPDFRRVAFVTRRFQELQGLMLAAMGAALIGGALSARALGADDGMFFYGCMQAPLLYAMLAVEDIRSSYRRTFGDAAISATGKMLAMVPALLVFLGASADNFHIFYRWPGPSVLAIVATALGVGVLLRDWPWRTHHLAVAAAGIVGIAATLGAPIVTMSSRATAVVAPLYSLAYALIGLALVGAGLLDHHLLVVSMTAPPATSDPQAIADRAIERAVAATASALIIAAALRLTHGGAGELTLAWELAMTIGFCVAVMLRSIFNARRKLAWLARRAPVESLAPMLWLPTSTGQLLGIFALALAATLDTIFMPVAVPLLTCVSLVVFEAMNAAGAHELPSRLLPSGITLSVAVLLTLSRSAPAMGFLVLGLTLSLALAVRFLHEWVLVRRARAVS